VKPSFDIPAVAPSLGEAFAAVRRVAAASSENFPVLSALVPEAARDDLSAVYAFCRLADDLADETGSDEAARARSLSLLRALREEVARGWAGQARHPVVVALADTASRTGMAETLATDLIGAFEQDQRVLRYSALDELIDYSRGSANPVGRMVLHLAMAEREAGGRPGSIVKILITSTMLEMSDAICTAMQLTNFWQDVRRDLLERDRVYLPLKEMGLDVAEIDAVVRGAGEISPDFAARYERGMRPLLDRTRRMFEQGRALPSMVPPAWAPVIRLFIEGGEGTLRLVDRAGVGVLRERPSMGKGRKAWMVGRAWVRTLWMRAAS
jgi:squalene synthase HpnC